MALSAPHPYFIGRASWSFGPLRYDWLQRFMRKSAWILLVCKLVIGLVSAYDIFLTIKYVEFLPWMEMNPIGRWLMNLDAGPDCQLGQIAGFIAVKFTGNILTLMTIELLCHWRRRIAVVVALSVAAFQLLLLVYLTTV